MLMLATGVGMFGATFSATLDRSFDDRARYAVGADVRASDLRALARAGDAAFLQALAAIPAGLISDRIGRKLSFVLGDGMGALMSLIAISTLNPTLLLVTAAIARCEPNGFPNTDLFVYASVANLLRKTETRPSFLICIYCNLNRYPLYPSQKEKDSIASVRVRAG